MKLYTKKMTYSLLAIGLLACAPVDANLIPGSLINCEKMCQGYFIEDANNKKLTGAIRKHHIQSETRGGTSKKRTCHCKYKGDLGIDKKKYFDQREATKKHLEKVSDHATSHRKCDRSKEVCLTGLYD